jgi:hypothetical protein
VRPTRNKPSQTATEGDPVEGEEGDSGEDQVDQEDDDVDVDDEFFDPNRESLAAIPPDNMPGRRKADRGNYRKLKIKSKNAKPKGRFGRRRLFGCG